MNRKRFSIPVGWNNNPQIESISRTHLASNTLVLDVARTNLTPPFEVERIPGSWSPHIPEKKPRYRITYGHDWQIAREPIRLSSATGTILVPLLARREQTCLDYRGKLHGIYASLDSSKPHTFCGHTPYLPWGISNVGHEAFFKNFVRNAMPTCDACLRYRAVWCLFDVFPYTPKQEVLTKERKERDRERTRLSYPTVYARILDDDLFENPSYKPVRKPLTPPTEQEDEYEAAYDDPRERKLNTDRERSRRIAEAKATVQGHRRR